MAQDEFDDWDVTASNNTSITGDGLALDIAEGWAAANINNAIRALMSACTLAYGAWPNGTSRPSYLTAGKIWRDDTTAAAPVFTLYDGTDDIQLFTVNYTTNTVSFNGDTTSFDIDGLTAETAPAVADTLAIYDDSASANRKMTLSNFFKIINGLTAETAPAVDDEIALYDTSGSATDKMTLANLFKVINALTAETAPATDDELALYDTSGTATDKITLANLLKVINSLTEDASPDTTNDFVVTYDASATAAKKVALTNLGTGAGYTRGTATATTSGTSHDYTSLPAGLNEIIVMFSGVSTNGTSEMILQIGDSGGVEATGYSSVAFTQGGDEAQTTGYAVTRNHTAASVWSGRIVLGRLDGNTWSMNGAMTDGSNGSATSGAKTLSAELDRIRLTTVGGSDTFDAGSINIEYR